MKKNGFTFMELIIVILVFGIIFYFTRPFINKLIEKVRFNSFENNVARLVKQGEAYHKMKELRNEMKSDVMFNLKDESTFDALDIKKKAYMSGFVKIKQNGEVLVMASNKDFCGYKMDEDVIVSYDLTNCNEDNYIDSIEDLVRMSNEAANGETNATEYFYLIKDLDFNDDASYEDPKSVKFGDFNKDGVVNTIKEEVTTSHGFYPVNLFSGALYGLGYSIKNLYINRNETDQALIRYTYNGKFKDMTLTGNVTAINGALLDALSVSSKFYNININGNLNVSGTGSGLLFTVGQGTDVSNITINGKINATKEADKIGAIGGSAFNSKFTDVSSKIDIIGSKYVGGLIGNGYFCNIVNAKTAGSIKKANIEASYIGGITGFLSHNSLIDNAFSNMVIEGDNYTGGITGGMSNDNDKLKDSIIMNSSYAGTLTNYIYGGGSIAGTAVGKIYNSFSNGKLIFPSSTTGANGGLVGSLGFENYDHSSLLMENCYFTGNINSSSNNEVGTLVGKLGANKETNDKKYTVIKNSYSISNLNGNNTGLIGCATMHGENLFNGGQINGYYNSGNIVGVNVSTFNNVHSIKQIGVITNNIGIQINDLKTSYLKDTVKLGNAYKYEEGIYPLLYKRKKDGTYKDELVPHQDKIKIK